MKKSAYNIFTHLHLNERETNQLKQAKKKKKFDLNDLTNVINSLTNIISSCTP